MDNKSNHILECWQRIGEIRKEAANTPCPRPVWDSDGEEDLDNYQERCEYSWWKRDLVDEYEALCHEVGIEAAPLEFM